MVAGPHTPSGSMPRVALELPERVLGLRSEDAVLAAGVEAERVEPPLQLGHVVAAQHGRAQVEQAIAERTATLDQRAPGLGPADAVDAQPAARLEVANRRRAVSSPKKPSSVTEQPHCVETDLEVTNCVAAVAEAQERGCGTQAMNSESSSSSCALPFAPTRRFFTSPSSKTSNVGMLMTS